MENNIVEIDHAIDLCGHTIKIVKNGLDIEEVSALFKQLVSERDLLVKRQENLTVLTRLYEKTVMDAGELAKQIEKETREQMQKEASTILTQAHERAKVMVEQQQAEANQLIQQRLKTVRSNVKKQLETLHKQELEKLQFTIKEAARRVSDEIMAQEESLAKQGNVIEVELGENLFEPHPAGEPEKTAEQTPAQTVARATTPAATVVKGIHAFSTAAKENPPAQTAAKATASSAAASGINANIVTVTGKAEQHLMEIEISLPHDKAEIDNITKMLAAMPETKNTELLTLNDKSLLKVMLSKSVDLLPKLQALPGIHHAEANIKDGKKKILITLSPKT